MRYALCEYMLWINFLHLYQPANAPKEKVVEATEKSYKFIISALENNPGAKITLNIAGCLLKRLDEELKYHDLILRLLKLINQGQIELTGSAAYHSLLPLVSEEEAIEQIKENEQILKSHFGKKIRLKGFFFPEMAYGAKTAKAVKKMGYEWIILDEISYNGRLGYPDPRINYIDRSSGLKVLFRNRKFSHGYVPDLIRSNGTEKDFPPLITATDAELYGLHHIDLANVLNIVLGNKEIQTNTISGYLHAIKDNRTEKIKLSAGSWESTPEELDKGIPYYLWYNANNPLHQKLWKLARLAEDLFHKYALDANASWSRWHLVRGLASCTFWWSSKKDFKHVFGPIAWNPDEVEKGANELIRSVRSLEKSSSLEEKLKAERLYFDVKKMIWEIHWREFHTK